ncbi:calcium release-activated calcium channel protein 1 [Holotrichia oblita]|uniref:Calcium release-activated calcium channel protein 1 n=1 Tax=Holotrichia oblita TaxID=644536 RepID=A0ACB9SR20_HOLOL|nr:calcium release-activated calcium channel protein 1 [Holotrichia oblita]
MSDLSSDLHTQRYLSWKKLHLSRAKLKASSKTSALLSGFAMVAMVELQLPENPEERPPPVVMLLFVIVTTLLVVVHMLALMISTCILPNLESVCTLDMINLVEESPHEKLHWYIETAWAFSTLFGLLLFLIEIGILCWMKFSGVAAWSATIILIPVLFLFLGFAAHFYISLVSHKYKTTAAAFKELEEMEQKIKYHSRMDSGRHDASEFDIV